MMSTNRKTIKLYWQHTRKYGRFFWPGTVGAALAVIVQDILPPFIIAKAFTKIESAYSSGNSLEFSELVPYAAAFVISMIAGMVLWRLQVILVWLYQIKVMRDLSQRCFGFLQNQGYRFHTDRFGGALVTQSNRFVASYERLMDEFTWSIVTGFVALTSSVIFLSFVSYQYAFILLTLSLTYMAIIYKRAKKQVPLNRNEAAKQSAQTAALADAITNVTTIRTFASEASEQKRFNKSAENLYDASHNLMRYAMKTELMSHSMTTSINITAVLFGFLAITTFDAPVAVLVLATAYTQAITNRLWQFGRVLRNINKALGDAAEMTENLQIESEIKDPINPQSAKIDSGKINFKNVDFGYGDQADDSVFNNLNLEIHGGEKVGLVGPSGGGKTTITKLVLRFLDISGGSIEIDNQDIRNITQHDLRSSIAYVPQEPLLFHRTIAENIGYGKIEAGRHDIERAAKMAHAHEFIKNLPKGYETLVGERGVKLSGGQRQRIAIARALLKDAPILILDEATSALDSESEKLIQDALWKLMEGRTAIVIAHRLSTIQRMDRIVVLDDGKVMEQGTHKDLLASDGLYAKLWRHQSGGFLED